MGRNTDAAARPPMKQFGMFRIGSLRHLCLSRCALYTNRPPAREEAVKLSNTIFHLNEGLQLESERRVTLPRARITAAPGCGARLARPFAAPRTKKPMVPS